MKSFFSGILLNSVSKYLLSIATLSILSFYFASSTAIADTSKGQVISQSNSSESVSNRNVLGRWLIKERVSGQEAVLVFTDDGKLFVVIGNNAQEVGSYKKISNEATLPSNAVVNNFATEQAARVRKSEARTYVGSMTRAQQAFYFEKNKFAYKVQDLGLGINVETENYSYRIVMIDEKRAVQSIGVAKKGDLKSYVGLAWVGSLNSTGTTLAILCESDQPTTRMPSKMEIPNTKAECPSGYSMVK